MFFVVFAFYLFACLRVGVCCVFVFLSFFAVFWSFGLYPTNRFLDHFLIILGSIFTSIFVLWLLLLVWLFVCSVSLLLWLPVGVCFGCLFWSGFWSF